VTGEPGDCNPIMPPGAVRPWDRLVHHRSITNVDSPTCDPEAPEEECDLYDVWPKASINFDGTKLLFMSTWNLNTDAVDLYEVDLSAY
jgi:hypothetical protein